MNPLDLLSKHVRNGSDVIIGENHAVMDQTLLLFSRTIESNPNSIGAVSLEAPIELQEVLDKVQLGGIDKETFVSEARIAYQNGQLNTASTLYDRGGITSEQYDIVRERAEGIIDDVLNNTQNFESLERVEEVHRVLGSMYDLAVTGREHSVLILANDLDRELSVMVDFFDDMTREDILALKDDRYDDTTDLELLKSQYPLSWSKPILVHRGENHLTDIRGNNNGIDDLLEAEGRKVITISHMPSHQALQDMLEGYALPNDGASLLERFTSVFNLNSGSLGALEDSTDAVILRDPQPKAIEHSNVAVSRMDF